MAHYLKTDLKSVRYTTTNANVTNKSEEQKTKQTLWPEFASELYRPQLVGELSVNFCGQRGVA
jgi:hypothetical protein